jgi:hypothetical protein
MKTHLPIFAAATLAAVSGSHASLVGFWNFDEGTGTTAGNSANASFPGTVAGGATWVAGPSGFGTALEMDGIDDQVDTTFSAITGGAPRTVAAWIRYPNQPSATPNEFDGIASWGNNSPNGSRWTFRISDSSAITPYRLRLEVAGGGIYGSSLLNDGLWHHVAVVQNGSTLGSVDLYVDGILETPSFNGAGAALAINTTVAAGTTFRIGSSGHATNYNFLGAIDEVRVYDQALTGDEVRSLMVPEPGSAGLILAGLGMFLRRRR